MLKDELKKKLILKGIKKLTLIIIPNSQATYKDEIIICKRNIIKQWRSISSKENNERKT